MLISTKGRYGIKAIIDIALYGEENPVTISSIAKRWNISENYLEQLIVLLKKEKLIKSVRGAKGGYLLNDDPKSITVGRILRILEGTLAPVECINEDGKKCGENEHCISMLIWEKIMKSIDEAVDSITLYDLVEEYKTKLSTQ